MATRPKKKGTKRMTNLHETTELTEELSKLTITKEVSYEFPGVWHIYLKDNRVFYLGDVNGPWGWNDEAGTIEGETEATEAKEVARDFAEWVKGLEA
jgi:hypothetical protein